MAYELFKERDADAEISWLKDTYGDAFTEAFDAWTHDLCVQAGKHVEFESAADFGAVLGDLLDGKAPSDLHGSWLEIKKAKWLVKAKAIFSIVVNRQPPWRVRVFEKHNLPGLSGRINIPIRVYVSIEDVEKRVVIRAVDPL